MSYTIPKKKKYLKLKQSQNNLRRRLEKRKEKHDRQIKELKDQSTRIYPKILQKAANQLKQAFNRVPKSLFSAKIPPPYIKSEDSRPLHFTKDGLHLMYFTETEFIKLHLLTSEIVLRRKLPRADLSPIFIDYSHWSHDDSKVFSMKTNRIQHKFASEIYI